MTTEHNLEGPLALDADILDRMIELRRHLHAHPELSNQECETQRYLFDALAREGIEGARSAAGTGIVVDIRGHAPTSNRLIAIRADIDALPIQEETGLHFASRRAGVMHACGHDAHAAMVFAAAATLHRRREAFGGTVRIIFQPAEEAEPLGGRRIVAEGLLNEADAAMGLHIDPHLEAGRIALGSGPYTLGSDIFDVVITGRSAHAAQPYAGVDAIAIGCGLVGEWQKLVSREADPFESLILSVTSFHGGQSYNILADEVLIKGTLRFSKEATRREAHRRLSDMTTAFAAVHRASARIDILEGEPPVINDAEMVSLVAEAVTRRWSQDSIVQAPGWSAADDFGFYAEKVPSVYFRLGVRDPEQAEVYPLHHPRLNIDERALPIGAGALIDAAVSFLSPRA